MAFILAYFGLLLYVYIEGKNVLALTGVDTGYLMSYWIWFAAIWGAMGVIEYYGRGMEGNLLGKFSFWVAISALVLLIQSLLILWSFDWFGYVDLMTLEPNNDTATTSMLVWHIVFTIICLKCRATIEGIELAKAFYSD